MPDSFRYGAGCCLATRPLKDYIDFYYGPPCIYSLTYIQQSPPKAYMLTSGLIMVNAVEHAILKEDPAYSTVKQMSYYWKRKEGQCDLELDYLEAKDSKCEGLHISDLPACKTCCS